ncbi:MAG: TRAM domain-containing protein, partial [Ignavibacteriaceae bacterium]
VEHYLNLIEKAKKIIPGVSFSTDIISGFPTETWEDHFATIEVMKQVRYDGAYMFKYSPREGTKAFKMEDDVAEEIKSKRLQEIVDLQQQISLEKNQEMIGKEEIILVEGFSKKSNQYIAVRTDTNKMVIIPIDNKIKNSDYIKVKINRATSGTLFGDYLSHVDIEKQGIALTA